MTRPGAHPGEAKKRRPGAGISHRFFRVKTGPNRHYITSNYAQSGRYETCTCFCRHGFMNHVQHSASQRRMRLR